MYKFETIKIKYCFIVPRKLDCDGKQLSFSKYYEVVQNRPLHIISTVMKFI